MCSLFVGTEVICFVVLALCSSIIALCSSAQSQRVLGVDITTQMQTSVATWASIGIPIAVVAGVGALYRVDHNVKLLFWYLLFSLPVVIYLPVWLMASGNACDRMVSDEIQEMGEAFVCGFTDTFLMMWIMMASVMHLLVTYIVWSASEEMADNLQMELTKYKGKLKSMAGVQGPTEQITHVMGPAAFPLHSQMARAPALAPFPGAWTHQSYAPGHQGDVRL